MYRFKRQVIAAEGLIIPCGPGRPCKHNSHMDYLPARRERRASSAESARSAPEEYFPPTWEI